MTMNTSKLRRMACLSVLHVILGACNYPPPPVPVEKIPTCLPDSLVSPTLLSPSKLDITLELRPEFRWEYPLECNPDQFIVEVVLHPLSGEFAVERTAEVSGSRRSWVPDEPLSEGEPLGWRVTAMSSAESGPEPLHLLFFTGPLCLTSSLETPVLDYPTDGAFVEKEMPWLRWRYPEPCLPDTFAVDLSTTPDFSGVSLVTMPSIPIRVTAPQDPLEDCSSYFWRVAAQKDGKLGPYTSTASFWTNISGECDFEAYSNTD